MPQNPIILIVDDDRDVLDIFQHKIAATEGDTLAIACETIEDALEVIKSHPEDISRIYLDVYLPGVNGVDSVALISEAIKDKNPKPMVIAMSGYSSVTLKEAAIANGARKFFPKPDLLRSDETFLESLYFEERRRPREDNSDWKKGIERTIATLERNLDKVMALITLDSDSLAVQVARLQGEQLTDGVRIEEIRKEQKNLESELEGMLDFLKFVKGFPGGYKAFFSIVLMIIVLLATFGDNILYATGVTEGVTSFIQRMMPKKGDR